MLIDLFPKMKNRRHPNQYHVINENLSRTFLYEKKDYKLCFF